MCLSFLLADEMTLRLEDRLASCHIFLYAPDPKLVPFAIESFPETSVGGCPLGEVVPCACICPSIAASRALSVSFSVVISDICEA